MLVLGRKVNETIVINNNIRITVLRVGGDRVRLGFEAPEEIKVIRHELIGPGDAGPEAGEPPIPLAPDGRGTGGEPQAERAARRNLEGRARAGGPGKDLRRRC